MEKISPRALEALRVTFAEWAQQNRWHLGSLSEGVTDEELYPGENEPDWWEGKSTEEILPKITSDPDSLADEVHQIRFDVGRSEAAGFLTEYRNKLLSLGCEAGEIIRILNFIDTHSEHSH